MEMYADIAKIALLVLNFALMIAAPHVAGEIAPQGLPSKNTINIEDLPTVADIIG